VIEQARAPVSPMVLGELNGGGLMPEVSARKTKPNMLFAHVILQTVSVPIAV